LGPALSAYLDLLRFLATVAVLCGHLEQDGFATAGFPLTHLGREAVVLFFVLSGYIIHHTTLARGHGPGAYCIARATRLYSVAVPAVLATVLLALLLAQSGVESLVALTTRHPVTTWTVPSALLFLDQCWWNRTALPLNEPYWSLCYEAWYYLLFGIFLYAPRPWRWPLMTASLLVAGPAIAALLPVWLLGAWLSARGNVALPPGRRTAWLVYLGSVAVIGLVAASGLDDRVRDLLFDAVPGFRHLVFAQRLFTDYLVGVAVVLHLWAFVRLGTAVDDSLRRLAPACRWLAGSSFTIYLCHRPMTLVWGALAPNHGGAPAYALFVAGVIVLACIALSYGGERRLAWWRAQATSLAGIRVPAWPRG